MSDRGVVFDIQRGALRDGPGVRTTVFLKGCPLRCRWCHNPESQRFEIETGRSGRTYGRTMSVREVMREVCRDRIFYEASGGGLTLSGGEPTAQFAFCRALLAAARTAGVATCLDTSGHCEPRRFRELIPLVDLFLFDFKASRRHRELTGVSRAWIDENFATLREQRAAVRLRCPLVPGVNDAPEHLEAIGALAASLPSLAGVDLLPYHALGRAKAADLIDGCAGLEFAAPTEADLARWRAAVPGALS